MRLNFNIPKLIARRLVDQPPGTNVLSARRLPSRDLKATAWLWALIVSASLLPAPAVYALSDIEVEFSGNHRLRYEYMHNGPRPNAAVIDDLLVSRLYLDTKVNAGHWFGELEIQDSRGWFEGESTPIGTDDINTLEPIQAFIGWRGGDDLPLQISVGRITKNLSTRRLVARNRYRNTTNGFSGVDVKWRGEDWAINAFAFRPVIREPSDRESIANNEFELDKTSPGQQFWGAELKPATSSEWTAHILALHESDRPDFPSRNRRLVTTGGQWYHLNKQSGIHTAGELGIQFGKSRATSADLDTRDLDHFAWFMHAEAGLRSEYLWQGRMSVLFDYASGDHSLGDGSTQRFDNLFGARRFDFGPTGIYGPQGRSNMISPGIRWDSQPLQPTRLMVVWRGFWLAEPFDIHAGTGFQDDFRGKRYVGQQVEARIRQAVTDDLGLEAGAAYLIKGGLLRGDAFAQGDEDGAYLYLQTTLRF